LRAKPLSRRRTAGLPAEKRMPQLPDVPATDSLLRKARLPNRAATVNSRPVTLHVVPQWLPPLAAASLVVVLLNVAVLVQRARERAQDWPAQLLRDLRRWDGLLPDELDRTGRR
jgi:hypothetical protein